MSTFSTFDIAGSALSAQSLRLNLTASNLANMHDVAGTPDGVYKAAAAVFRAATDPFGSALAGVDVLGVVESTAPAMSVTTRATRRRMGRSRLRPNVNAMEEMANMISASRSYQNNLEVINTAKELLLGTLRSAKSGAP